MNEVTFSAFDASKYLDTDEAINDYLAIALEDGDTKTVQVVLRLSSLKKLSSTANPSTNHYPKRATPPSRISRKL